MSGRVWQAMGVRHYGVRREERDRELKIHATVTALDQQNRRNSREVTVVLNEGELEHMLGWLRQAKRDEQTP